MNDDFSEDQNVNEIKKHLKVGYEPMIRLADYRDPKEKCHFHN